MMDDQERAKYHGKWWPDACQAKSWRVKDDERRRHVALECMRLVRGPMVTTSHPDWGHNETTALRTYLVFLADPTLQNSQRWLDCQTDYVAFNRARQGDWHERQAYGAKGGGKLRRNRFGGATSAQGEPQETFDPDAAMKRHMTMANRNRKRTGYRSQKQPAGQHAFVAMIDGKIMAGPELAGQKRASSAESAENDHNCPW